MSDATKAALDAAIEAHVADESGQEFVGAYVVLVETTGLDAYHAGGASWFSESRGSTLTQRGLIEAWRDVDRSERVDSEEDE